VFDINTYIGHKWIVRDAKSGKFIMEAIGYHDNSQILIPASDAPKNPVNRKMTMQFKNESDSKSIKIYWIDFAGKEIFYKALGPKEIHS